MRNLLLLAIVLTFASCEKEVIEPDKPVEIEETKFKLATPYYDVISAHEGDTFYLVFFDNENYLLERSPSKGNYTGKYLLNGDSLHFSMDGKETLHGRIESHYANSLTVEWDSGLWTAFRNKQ